MAERVGFGHAQRDRLIAKAARVPTALWFVMLVLGGVITAAIISVVVTSGKSSITGTLAGLPAGSNAHQFVVRNQVDKAPQAKGICVITVEDHSDDTVGTFTDTIEPSSSQQRQTDRTVIVPTSRAAVAVAGISCHLVVGS